MKRIIIKVRTDNPLELPNSDGYQIYSALLKIIQTNNPKISEEIHSDIFSFTSISGTLGLFSPSSKSGYKMLSPLHKYEIIIGISDNNDDEIARSLLMPFIFSGTKIFIENGYLEVVEISESSSTLEEIIESSSKIQTNTILLLFLTPTCIQYKNSKVTEMFPHRVAVFKAMLNKWNRICPENSTLNLEEDDFGRYLIERPILSSLKTHSVVVNRLSDKKNGYKKAIKKQGFSGKCEYEFSQDAPKIIKKACIQLALLSQFTGIGSSVARGCGCVQVDFLEDKNGI